MLLYPDYLTDDYGSDIFMGWACVPTPEEAIPIVQRKAVRAQRDLADNSTGTGVDDPEDFKMIAVWRGRTVLELDASSAI
jgi:hypothetical protein